MEDIINITAETKISVENDNQFPLALPSSGSTVQSKRKGFTDLPAEIRNEVYDVLMKAEKHYPPDGDGFKFTFQDVRHFTNTCQTLRSELRSLNMARSRICQAPCRWFYVWMYDKKMFVEPTRGRICLTPRHLARFMKMTADTTVAKDYTDPMKISINIRSKEFALVGIDVKELVTTIHQFPNIEFEFLCNHDEQHHLEQLLANMKSRIWVDRIGEFILA